MGTHSDDRSQFRITESRKKGIRRFNIYQVAYIHRFTIYQVVYTCRFTIYQVTYIRRFTIYQLVYTHRFTIYKGVYNVHMHFHRRKGVYMLENMVLVCGIWSMVL